MVERKSKEKNRGRVPSGCGIASYLGTERDEAEERMSSLFHMPSPDVYGVCILWI